MLRSNVDSDKIDYSGLKTVHVQMQQTREFLDEKYLSFGSMDPVECALKKSSMVPTETVQRLDHVPDYFLFYFFSPSPDSAFKGILDITLPQCTALLDSKELMEAWTRADLVLVR